MTENVKQVIVMRTDLNMRKGKMAAQAAHASMKAILDHAIQKKITTCRVLDTWTIISRIGDPVELWLNGVFTKVVVGCKSEEELLSIYNAAKNQNLICSLITDAGFTEFHGNPTITCCAIGPHWAEEIDQITGKLKLL